MAFTAPAATPAISADGLQLEKILIEMKTALNERRACIGLSQVSFPSIPGSIISNTGGTYITTLRASLTSLLAPSSPWTTNGFVKNDYTIFGSITDVLTAAGYPGGWITDYRIQNSEIWTQFQDVFAQLVVYRKYRSLVNDTSVGYIRQGSFVTGLQPAWDSMRAASLSSSPNLFAYVGWQMFDDVGDTRFSEVKSVSWNVSFPSNPGSLVHAVVGATLFASSGFSGSLTVGILGSTITLSSPSQNGNVAFLEFDLGTTSMEMAIIGSTPTTVPFSGASGFKHGHIDGNSASLYYLLSAGDGLTYG